MNIKHLRDFILAGNATGTFVNHGTGNRYTFKFDRPKQGGDDRATWVSVLSGPDNEADYRYVGTVWSSADRGLYLVWTGKSCFDRSSDPYIVADYLLYRINLGSFPDGVEFLHAGKCGRCGHKLTTPESIETGLGPVCAKKQS